jgi:hypothetical protein
MHLLLWAAAAAAAAAADAVCIVSVIALLVARLDKDSHLTELARKLALDISKQVRVVHLLLLCSSSSSSSNHTAGRHTGFGHQHADWVMLRLVWHICSCSGAIGLGLQYSPRCCS